MTPAQRRLIMSVEATLDVAGDRITETMETLERAQSALRDGRRVVGMIDQEFEKRGELAGITTDALLEELIERVESRFAALPASLRTAADRRLASRLDLAQRSLLIVRVSLEDAGRVSSAPGSDKEV